MPAGRIALIATIAAVCSLADSLPEALRSGRFQDALTLADSMLKAQPRDARIWTGRGVALAGLGRDRESVSSFEKALEFAPDFLPALKGAVEAAYRSHDPRTPTLLERLIRLEPASEVAHGIAGVLAFEGGDCRGAVSHFEKAGRVDSRAGTLFGACLMAVDRAADAVPVFERLLAADPDSTGARFNLGYALAVSRKYEEAVRTLEPLASGPAVGADTLNLLATAEAEMGRLEAAVAHLQQAIRRDPKDEKNYVDLASLCMRNESNETAVAIVEAGLAQAPDSAQLHMVRGILKVQLGQHDDAAAEFDRANRLDPRRQFGDAGLGLLYTEMRQTDRASAVLRERLKKSPKDATLNFLLAQALVQEGVEPGSAGFVEAAGCLKSAIASQPDLGKAHTLLGKLYVQSADYSQAVDELRLGARYDPSDRMAFSQLAIALRRLGREQEATAAVEGLRRIIAREARPKGNYKVIRITPAPGAASQVP